MADVEKVKQGIKNCIADHDCYQDCPYFDDCHDLKKPMFADLAKDAMSAIEELQEEIKRLKEQEIGHWVALENCSNAGIYCSECRTKIFDHYPIKKKLSYFCPHCGTRMEGEIERR